MEFLILDIESHSKGHAMTGVMNTMSSVALTLHLIMNIGYNQLKDTIFLQIWQD